LGNIASADDKAAVDALTALTDRKQVRDRNLMKAANDALRKMKGNK
jgi:hypothetical protein